MITQETAARIWNAHREIQTGIKLLEDVAKERERHSRPVDERAPTIRDAFGHRRHFQLGVPTGENGHKLFEVSPVLADACIRAHIENKRRDLAEANEAARIELMSNDTATPSQEERAAHEDKARLLVSRESASLRWAQATAFMAPATFFEIRTGPR